MDKISFIIISFNRPDDTIEAVKSILSQDKFPKDGEIIVVNNNSDLSYKSFENFLESNGDAKRATKYIESPTNLGVAKGRNLGIKSATGDLLFFIDDDATFKDTNVITYTKELFKKYENRNLGIVAYNEHLVKEGKFNPPTKSSELAKEKEFFTWYFIGCGHAIKREVLDGVGIYRDESFYGMEEYDLAYRVIDNGYSIFYTSEVEILHMKNPMGRQSKHKVAQMLMVNKTIIAYRYLSNTYAFSHLALWSGLLMIKHPLHFFQNLITIFGLVKKLKNTPREPISKDALKYIKDVQGRLWY